ncbi:16S rRNA (cytidine(1402)-2'-O)-methyltransferase [Taklimakanibacter deserti]|uniref:16S rRNA (cytidine(1402)-2'-O)-methyltransferase n=1 Tax=Taklimakanibacter deserti TaxID=2267839 RepID=UPI000E64CF8D
MSATTAADRRYSIKGAVFEAERLAPGLHVTSTPIGHLADISLRAVNALAAADEILCEDTRVTGKLLQRYGISTRLVPYHDHNAAKLRPRILAELAAGKALVLVSDAGTPLISDPGFKLARAVIEAGLPLHVIPGASAPLAALALSGLPSDRFMFCGFLPEKQGERRRLLGALKTVPATLIFFESPRRIEAALADITETLGPRPVAVTRELTKLYEEVVRGPAPEVAAQLAERETIKGEITLVVSPPLDEAPAPETIDEALLEASGHMPAGKAAAEVAHRFGLAKKELYDRLLVLKDKKAQ